MKTFTCHFKSIELIEQFKKTNKHKSSLYYYCHDTYGCFMISDILAIEMCTSIVYWEFWIDNHTDSHNIKL